ncbi:MAG: tetratricopeptide repeat protein [Planctomycetes bacterium]|nr:tetratricopeptide repeat protein [Planctomycetota bacterium]
MFIARIALIVCVGGAASAHAGEAQRLLTQADSLRLTGRYEEAEELYSQAADDATIAAAIGRADCLRARGQCEQAVQLLETTAEAHPQSAALTARLSQFALERGDHQEAEKLARRALELDEDNVLARWVVAELHVAAGRLDEAEKDFEWFIDHYNQAERIESLDDLHLIGQAAAEYARWTRNSNQFRFLVSELYPGMLRRDENYWPARLAAGLLFLEKYNESAAAEELNAALAINPRAAEIHAARAGIALQSFNLAEAETAIEQALELNPRLVGAHQHQADLHMANFKLAEAIDVLEQARELNPRDEATLGRLAAACGALDGLPADFEAPLSADSRMAKIIAEAVERNEHCGRFFLAMGDAFDLLRRYPAAAHFYREAHQRMPQLIQVPGKLGMVHMRLGEEVEAAKLLDNSFDADPFNVRVKNTLEVLDVLSGYAVLETEHFVIKFDRGQDEILAQAVARHLEDVVYPAVTKTMGYEPPEKTLFEIFNRARTTGGHGWFSARMVGLPYIGTVGACAGKMVAMVSPDAMPQKFHWGRVLGHEFIHVVNLQQTNFNVPHWFTEALAVWHEDLPRPSEWTELLARRRAAGKLFNLDDVNFGFVRPADGDDWTLAYCQAELYAEHMLIEYGEDALAKMLAAYADNLDTREALRRCFHVEQEEFEERYLKFVDRIIAEAGPLGDAATLDLAWLQDAVKEDPKDAENLARLAYAYLQRKANPQARRLALAAQQVEPQQQLAAYVLARLQLSIGDARQALELLENAVSEEDPQENALALLAGLKLQAKDYEAAARLYRTGLKKLPGKEKWLKALARVYLTSQDNDKLTGVLGELAEIEYDDVLIRKKLAIESLEKKDYAAAEKWASDALLIDVTDAELHAALAQAAAGQENYPQAIDAYALAVRLEPKQSAWRFALADAQVQTGRKDAARETLEELLKQDPDYPGADVLLESLQ